MKVLLFSLVILALANNLSASLLKHYRRYSTCPIELYDRDDSSFTGEEIYANVYTFHPLLRALSRYARRCHVIINVTQSFPGDNSTLSEDIGRVQGDFALDLGKAIEFELLDENQNLLCNRTCIGQYPSRSFDIIPAKCFLREN